MAATRKLVSILGALGTLLCVAGGLGVWYVESRVDRARVQVFERVDQAFAGINGRLVEAQKIAAQSKITLDEIQQHMKDWTKNEASERLVARFDLESRAQQLTAGLQQAEMMLELSQDTVQHVRQMLEVGAELGLPLNAESVDPLLGRIGNIKQDLTQAIDTTESLRQRITEDGDDASLAERMEQAAKFIARLLATFGNVDSRLTSFQSRLNAAQDVIKSLDAKTHTRVVAAAVIATLFFLWMGAGQFYLWRCQIQIGLEWKKRPVVF